MIFKNKKATVTIYITGMIAAMVILIIAAVMSPLGVLFNVEMFKAGEKIMNQSQESLNDIQDATIRNQINASITSAKNAQVENITVLSDFFQYAWVIVIGLTGLILFLFSRRIVETTGGSGFV